ncbi:histidine phosphatase family protein [Streptomyces sp. NPDC127098]|uniref:histidine phosphatase family protein n=1 Tax=Streptomyces sp. NPDC127098 TaxID=3347137 RepID=UPI00364E884E
MRLLWIRHGQTPANLAGLLDTAAPGEDLTAEGRRQAAALPELLAGERIDALFASTLARAVATAEPLASARGLRPRLRDGLRELAAGELEGRGDAAAVGTYRRVACDWARGRTEVRMPGGESGAEALGRLDAVVAEAAAAGSAVAVVGHGSAIRVWTAVRAVNVSVEFVLAHEVPNGGVVALEGEPGRGWRAVSWAGAPFGDAPVAVSG